MAMPVNMPRVAKVVQVWLMPYVIKGSGTPAIGNNPNTIQMLIMAESMMGRIRPAAKSFGSAGLIV